MWVYFTLMGINGEQDHIRFVGEVVVGWVDGWVAFSLSHRNVFSHLIACSRLPAPGSPPVRAVWFTQRLIAANL